MLDVVSKQTRISKKIETQIGVLEFLGISKRCGI